MNLKLNRREFLQVGTGGALGVAASGVTLQGLSNLNAALAAEEVQVPQGPETWVPSICSMCAAGCGLRVRKIGERAVKIQGNPLHPVNHGGLCPKGIAALQALYHPDRLRTPQKNVGSREKPKWKEISWDDALAEIVGHMRKLRESGQAHTVVLIDRDQRNLAARLLRRFLLAYGSPNYLVMPSGLDALQTAVYLQQGVTRPVAYDFENARYVLSFGVDLLEGWGSPASIMRAFGSWRDSASGRRTKFVQIEPRLSVTAARADEWVSLRPGTEAALALGIAYVLITEGLYDAAFVQEHTFGFDDWHDAQGRSHMGLRSLVLRDYRLNDVATLAEVPAETILRIAREIGHNRPALVIGDRQTSTLPGNPYAAMAVHCLNALLGSFEVPGGVLLQQHLPLPEDNPPGTAIHASRIDAQPERPSPAHHLDRLPGAILSRRPYPVEMLLLNEVDPVFARPNGDSFRKALQQVPFVVSFTTLANDTSALADLVLPVPTELEKWQDAGSPPAFPYAVQAMSPPAVSVRYNARPVAEVVLALARALGGAVAAALPFDSLEQYLRKQSDLLFKAQTGAVFAPSLEETWNRLLERSGWWAPGYATAEELWEQIKRQGGWWEPTYSHGEWDRVLQTPSGRFEFFSQRLAEWASTRPQFARQQQLPAGDDRLCLPHQPPLAEGPAGFPFLLLPVEVLPLAGGEGAHLPYLQQIAGLHLSAHWDSWLEIHPETAHKLGIKDGDSVWVESRRGRAQARARLYLGVRPDVVHLPLGYGQRKGAPWACRGLNPLDLVEEQYDPLAGLPQTSGTYVKVYRS